MKTGYIDAHCHIFFIGDVNRVIERCIEKGLSLAIETGINPKTNRIVLKESEKYPVIKAALGFHPTDLSRSNELKIYEEINFIERNANKIIAIGEVGLDYYWIKEKELKEKQKRFLYEFIELADRINKPLIIHSRNAEEECLEILSTSSTDVILHSFLCEKIFKKALSYDFYISIPSIIYKDKRYSFLAKTPMERILTETDSPFLDPIGFRKNEPWKVIYCIKALSNLKKIEEEEILKHVVNNFNRLFKTR